MSKGEDKLFIILRANQRRAPQIYKNLTREKIFKDLKYKGTPLRYDLYMEVRGVPYAWEFDGQQHFEYVKFFHKKRSTFKHMQENDRRKNRYAIKNKINLYRIPYTEIDSINTIQDMVRPQYKVKSIYHNDNLKQSR